MESSFKSERNKRVVAEKASALWKEKALLFKRKLQDEAKKNFLQNLSNKQSSKRSVSILAASGGTIAHSAVSIAKATPSIPRARETSIAVSIIDQESLGYEDGTKHIIGEGCFGSCTRMVYSDMFIVCNKQVNESVSLQAVKAEAATLLALNGSGYTPYCFGYCPSLRSIIMAYVSVGNRSMSMQSLLYDQELMTPSKEGCTDILVHICRALQYIHQKGFLHNDLKLDNIVLGNTLSQTYKPFIIDFGKSCPVNHGKRYSLSAEQIEVYKKEHSQIAPDLRDGVVAQSIFTDIYSLGRIIKHSNAKVIKSKCLAQFCRQILCYSSCDRPDIPQILNVLMKK